MIKAIVKIENEWNQGEVNKKEVEFEKIDEIEHYLAYNRGYIRSIKFVGSIKEED